ncbi:BREX system P-loop protein BrxC [Actinomyces procaprae]|uniref:BREX system P-loop protein BrxC n=1 Tax=Actinomyces procaprae TaxID=2560010 RepID=UPI001FFA4129|nr:BREX system P-loop protein BrxC [Actinomyces procaprae]
MSQMTIGSLFAKDVSRPIEGVIKADDAEHLATEIDEYVLTGETASALSELLETYTDPVYNGGNGVWISGFFGSGKSHLLKMLAYLLGDVPGRPSARRHAVESFKEKADAEQDAFLRGKLAQVERIPATSLLFNIDQKAPLIDKNQTDALLQVFVKVFNEARGYYAGEPSVARFERDLDRRGLLADFKRVFTEIAGVAWEQGREEGILQEHNVTQAFSQVTGEPASESILSRYEEQYSLSIEDFADEVAQWLEAQPASHRLLFMVDEVGQFIGSSTKLMLNLQTIVETLSTRCNGRAWVCVTSQEDMDGVIGDRTKTQGNDFSKIQARFATRMKLTSHDVEEVVKKRLLSKTAAGDAALDPLYDEFHTSFRTLFDFVDGSKTYRNYDTRDRFAQVYPFVPYQFPFFQAALVGLSDHNVFEGRHASVGERSMLGVVQEVATHLKELPVGAVVPFDAMFTGIRQAVKSAATRNIATAQAQLPEGPVRDVAVRLLKALFLVKYVGDFTATPRNLTVLLYDRFGQDLTELNRQVSQALDLLEQQTYVQRNGSAYEYLTNEEQDIENEIKNTDVDSEEVSKLLAEVISQDVVRGSSVRHSATGRDFKYQLLLDEVSYNLAQPLAVHYISSALGLPREVVVAQSMGRDELRVVLADDARMYQDLRLLVQTNKYVRLRAGSSLTESQSHILDSKKRQNGRRRKELISRVKQAIGDAELIIGGASIAVSASDPVQRVQEGMDHLITRTYTYLSMLGSVAYSESDIARLASEEVALLDRSTDTLQPLAEEVHAWISSQRERGVRTTVKQVVSHFEDKPYGWTLASILCAITRLVVTSRVSLTLDGSTVKRTELPAVLPNGKKHDAIAVTPQRSFDPGVVRDLRSFAQEFFATGQLPNDPMELAADVGRRLADEYQTLKTHLDAYGKTYPFLIVLNKPLELLQEVTGHDADWYLDKFSGRTDDLLDVKQDVIDPVSQFLSGSQRTIYDDAVRLLAERKDTLRYLKSDEAPDVKALLDDQNVFRGQRMKRLKDATAELRAATDRILADERASATDLIHERANDLRGSAAWERATGTARSEVDRATDAAMQQVAEAVSVPVIRQLAREFDEESYEELLAALEADRRQAASHAESGAEAPPAPVVIPLRQLPRPRRRVLRTSADVDAYVDELRDILHNAVVSGKQVSL